MLKIEDVVKLIDNKRFLENRLQQHVKSSYYNEITGKDLKADFIYEGDSSSLNYVQCEVKYNDPFGTYRHSFKFLLSKYWGKVSIDITSMESYSKDIERNTYTASFDAVPTGYIVELSELIKAYVEEIDIYE